jgi:hypothetical protein
MRNEEMTTYAFTAFGATKKFKASRPSEGMAQANQIFPLGNGMWMEAGANAFKWVEGNFFD